MNWDSEYGRVRWGITSFYLWLWVNILTCANLWGQSKQLGLSVPPEHSQSAIMMWPVVCTPGHLFTVQSMEMCWYSCSFTFQGHSAAAGNSFHHLKHLFFPTFLLLYGVTYFPVFQHCKLNLTKPVNLNLIWEIHRKMLNRIMISSRTPCAHLSVM